MAKKILAKKDFNALIKGSVSAVTVEYKGIKIGYEYKLKTELMIMTDLNSGIEITRCLAKHYQDYERFLVIAENMFNQYTKKGETLDEASEIVIAESVPQSLAEQITNEISKNIEVSGMAQLNVALLIRTVYEKKLFEELGYVNVYEYCADRFGIARGTTSNWLMLATNFGVYDKASQRYILDSRLKGYSITQLVLLRSLSIDDIEAYFETSMSCREIKGKVEGLNKHITSGAVEVKSPIENEESSDDAESENIEASKKVSVTKKPNFIFELQGGMDFKQSKALEVILHALSTHKGKMFELKMTIKD